MQTNPIKFYKTVVNLPTTLEPNTIYLVRVGQGFDFYLSDLTGSIAYEINSPDLQDLASVDIDTSSPIPVGYVLKWNGTKWSPALDDTSETAGSLQVYDEGSTVFPNINTMNFKGTGVTVTSSSVNSVDVNINTDFIGFNIDGGLPDSIYGGINPIDAGHL